MPAVHKLVEELALFEKAPEEVRTSPEEYAVDGFGEQPAFECLVAVHPRDGIVGTAFYYFAYYTWKGRMIYLDDLVITEAHRRSGIGSLLMDALIDYGKGLGIREIRWQVLDWNEPAIKLYEKLGARLDGEWINCRY